MLLIVCSVAQAQVVLQIAVYWGQLMELLVEFNYSQIHSILWITIGLSTLQSVLSTFVKTFLALWFSWHWRKNLTLHILELYFRSDNFFYIKEIEKMSESTVKIDNPGSISSPAFDVEHVHGYPHYDSLTHPQQFGLVLEISNHLSSCLS